MRECPGSVYGGVYEVRGSYHSCASHIGSAKGDEYLKIIEVGDRRILFPAPDRTTRVFQPFEAHERGYSLAGND
jgi:hypothetical protein